MRFDNTMQLATSGRSTVDVTLHLSGLFRNALPACAQAKHSSSPMPFKRRIKRFETFRYIVIVTVNRFNSLLLLSDLVIVIVNLNNTG